MTLTHEPPGYVCLFCQLVAGETTSLTTQRDVIRRTAGATAIMSPHWWPKNRGHVLVVPNAHHENLYDLPAEAGHAMLDLVREMAMAIRHGYQCEGVSIRQNNEPAGDQDVWHVHVHVLPRYPRDQLIQAPGQFRLVSAQERRPYADRLRAYFEAPHHVIDDLPDHSHRCNRTLNRSPSSLVGHLRARRWRIPWRRWSRPVSGHGSTSPMW